MTPPSASRQELATRAVRAGRWDWWPGMLATVGPDDERTLVRVDRVNDPRVIDDDTARPVLSDPATIGCVLHLVRGAFPDCTTVKNFGPAPPGAPGTRVPRWCVVDAHGDDVCGPCASESEALVVALEKADETDED